MQNQESRGEAEKEGEQVWGYENKPATAGLLREANTWISWECLMNHLLRTVQQGGWGENNLSMDHCLLFSTSFCSEVPRLCTWFHIWSSTTENPGAGCESHVVMPAWGKALFAYTYMKLVQVHKHWVAPVAAWWRCLWSISLETAEEQKNLTQAPCGPCGQWRWSVHSVAREKWLWFSQQKVGLHFTQISEICSICWALSPDWIIDGKLSRNDRDGQLITLFVQLF